MIKKILKISLIVLLILLAIVVSYVLYLVFSYSRIEDNQALVPKAGATESEVHTGTVYTAVTQNFGFGAYTPDFTFFMDGGTQSWANSKESVNSCIEQAADEIKSHDPDFVLMQEVDFDSTRSYHIDEKAKFESAFPGYGKLSGQNADDRETGASERLNVDTDKESPEDFALWKAQKPGEPAWDSPWGKGRPGWHIECSAMSMKYLGETFDIHCGGKDLLFPHHENEIAQSEGATGKKYVNYWMHNGFINVDNQKMSKSLNNFFTVRDIAKDYDLEAVRLFMLSAHYRSPINFSRDQIESANASLNRLYTARNSLKFQMENGEDRPLDDREKAFVERLKGYEKRFDDAMDDDMNTADALGAIFELVKDANVTIGQGASREAASAAMKSLESICDVLGILSKKEEELPAEIAALVNERAEARKNKDWAKSDELRNRIIQAGYVLEDTKQGQKVRKDV